jgi:hypothetical protein
MPTYVWYLAQGQLKAQRLNVRGLTIRDFGRCGKLVTLLSKSVIKRFRPLLDPTVKGELSVEF